MSDSSAQTVDQAVDSVVSAIIELRKTVDKQVLLTDWKVGQLLNDLAKNFKEDALNKAIKQRAQADTEGDTMSLSSAYRLRRLNSNYSEAIITRMAEVGVSTNQAVKAVQFGDLDEARVGAVLDRIVAKELSKSGFSEALSTQPAKSGETVTVNTDEEQTASAPRSKATNADNITLDDTRTPAKPSGKRRGRKPATVNSTPREDQNEVSTDDPIEVMGAKVVHGLEAAIKTLGGVLIFVDRINTAKDEEKEKAAKLLQTAQERLRDIIEAGGRAKDELFKFEVVD